MNYDAWLMEPYEHPDRYDFSSGVARYKGRRREAEFDENEVDEMIWEKKEKEHDED